MFEIRNVSKFGNLNFGIVSNFELRISNLLFVLITCLLWNIAAADDSVVALGKEAFGMHCARCHGAEAKGDGPDAKRLTVVPRDITSGRFKFKTTVQGTPPSDDDIMNGILGHGLPGSGMPSFANLETETRSNIVAYIKSISPAFQTQQKPQPIPLPANMRAKPDLAKGKGVYEKLQCALCHGVGGHANGTSAFTLVDAWNRPIRSANLTQGWTYRGGSRAIDVYYRILAGIDGAPMPSYEGAATHEEIWLLSEYVRSLQLDENWSGEIAAAPVKGELPTSVGDPAWKDAKRTDVNMQEYVYANGKREHLTVNAVSVQALYNEEAVVFRIFWEDPIKSEKGLADSLLVALKPKDYTGDVRGNLHTLYEPDSSPLDLMLWQSSRPDSVGQRKTNLASATSNWSAAKTMPSSAVYEDGRWTLTFTRPFDLDKGSVAAATDPLYIGFSAWDGNNGEAGKKHTASQWIRLVRGQHGNHE